MKIKCVVKTDYRFNQTKAKIAQSGIRYLATKHEDT